MDLISSPLTHLFFYRAACRILPRFYLNFIVAFVYYAFFYAGLYVFRLSGRKFLEGSYPTLGNMVHNMWYWMLGIVQWTFWEAVMVRLWATGVVEYKTAEEIFADKRLLAINVLWVITIPVWRDVHFYIAHRFLHIRAIYTYVHKLHHRNADPEPFSGITMHPVEHLCVSVKLLFLRGAPEWSCRAHKGMQPGLRVERGECRVPACVCAASHLMTCG